MSPLERALADAQSIESEFGCQARACVRRDAPPGVEAIVSGGRVRLSGDAAEVRAVLLKGAAAATAKRAARRRSRPWRRALRSAAAPARVRVTAGEPGPQTRELRDKTAAQMAVTAWALEEAGHGRRAAALRDGLAVYLASLEDRPGKDGSGG